MAACAAIGTRIRTSAVCGIAVPARSFVEPSPVSMRLAWHGRGSRRCGARRAARDGAARDEPRVRHCGGDRGAPAAARQRARVRELLHRVRDAEGDDQSQPVLCEPTIAQSGRTTGFQFFQ